MLVFQFPLTKISDTETQFVLFKCLMLYKDLIKYNFFLVLNEIKQFCLFLIALKQLLRSRSILSYYILCYTVYLISTSWALCQTSLKNYLGRKKQDFLQFRSSTELYCQFKVDNFVVGHYFFRSENNARCQITLHHDLAPQCNRPSTRTSGSGQGKLNCIQSPRLPNPSCAIIVDSQAMSQQFYIYPNRLWPISLKAKMFQCMKGPIQFHQQNYVQFSCHTLYVARQTKQKLCIKCWEIDP